ncbi:hypothetical protein HC928_13330 [bacterium]|nr:hypothetical protein [bacterium]
MVIPVPRLMDLRLDHVRERFRRKEPLLPTPTSTSPPIQQQRQQSTSKRRPALLPTPSSYTQRTQQESRHSQFTTMVTYLNVTLRLMFGLDNWKTSFPQRLATSLLNFTDSIQPPRRTDSCSQRLQEATQEYQNNIRNIVASETTSNILDHLRLLRQIRANLSDWRLAADTAERQLKRSHKHLSPSTTQRTLNSLIAFALDSSTSPAEELVRKYFPSIVLPACTVASNTSDDQFITLSSTDHNNTSCDQYIILSSTNANTPDTSHLANDPTPLTASTPTTATPAAVPSPPSPPTTAKTIATPAAVPANSLPSSPEATAADQPSIDEITIDSADEEDTTVPAANPPIFIVPRTSPLSASDLRRQLPSTPAVSNSSTLPSAIHTPTPPLPQRLRPRRNRMTIPSKQHSTALIASTPLPTASGTSTAVNNIRSFRYEEKDQWKINTEPSDAVDTLVIADSNGKRWNDAPSNWLIYSFGGMKLVDVSRIMAAAPNIKKYKHVIIHCGRNDSYLSVKANVSEFVNFLQAYRHRRLLIVPSLADPQLHEPGLRLFHNVVSDEFGDMAIIHDEPQFYHRLHSQDVKHYSRTTARHLIHVILHRLN